MMLFEVWMEKTQRASESRAGRASDERISAIFTACEWHMMPNHALYPTTLVNFGSDYELSTRLSMHEYDFSNLFRLL